MIRIENLSKRFDEFPALHDINLHIKPGEFIALLGPSGSGKTTLLRIIAGLEFQDQGRVLFNGDDVTDRSVAERGVGFVFQHYALFKHMTVAENVAFGLSVKKRRERPSRAAIAARAEELLRLVQLPDLGKRYPGQLSGGQRQRVALARALAVNPRLLLLDEPFGALDAKVRKDLRRWLVDLHRQMGLTSIFVTHDQDEALEMADRVVVMDHGVIEQIGTPEEVYMNPASPFVSNFVGEINRMKLNGNELHVRPHDIEIVAEGGQPVRVETVFRRGGAWRIEGRIAPGSASPATSGQQDGGQLVEIDLPASEAAPNPGETILIAPRRSRTF